MDRERIARKPRGGELGVKRERIDFLLGAAAGVAISVAALVLIAAAPTDQRTDQIIRAAAPAPTAPRPPAARPTEPRPAPTPDPIAQPKPTPAVKAEPQVAAAPAAPEPQPQTAAAPALPAVIGATPELPAFLKAQTPPAAGATARGPDLAAAPARVDAPDYHRPAWRAHAGDAPATPGRPVVGVALIVDPRHAPDPASLPAPLSLVVPGDAAPALLVGAREAGMEILALDAETAPDQAVGVARSQPAEAALDAIAGAGGLALALAPVPPRPGLGDSGPVIGADLLGDRGMDALASFDMLREAARRAQDEGYAVVALNATPRALRALTRWSAVETRAAIVPVSRAAARIAMTEAR